MPAFVPNGPDIPDSLLRAHEDGEVVLFCGAGVSSAAGLPSFSDLTGQLYESLQPNPNRAQEDAICRERFDTAIGLLEREVLGGRETVRRRLAEILTGDLSNPKATATHEALLLLGRTRKRHMHLVTTNFDRVFEHVIAAKRLSVATYEAPLLPVPKTRWDGLVYLHGRLPPNPSSDSLDHLVVSSGDFGLAYLAERWAARFVTELFRKFTVCFVGYSINDPVLRYMTDALAAESLQGERVLRVYAFAGFDGRDSEQAREDWEAKGVAPILYRSERNHALLHETLQEWANIYRDGINGKQMVVVKHAAAAPPTHQPSDFVVEQVLWALTDEVAASKFADLDPPPPLEWIEPLSRQRYRSDHLPQFDLAPDPNTPSDFSFSFLSHPAKHASARPIALTDAATHGPTWDHLMGSMAKWLLRHLDNPRLILWLAEQGGKLRPQFAAMVQEHLEHLDGNTRTGDELELERLRSSSPQEIPRPAMRRLWNVMLAGYVTPPKHEPGLQPMLKRLKDGLLSHVDRLRLRSLLSPRAVIQGPLRPTGEPNEPGRKARVDDLTYCDVTLAGANIRYWLDRLHGNENWASILPTLLPDFVLLLNDTLELKRELEQATWDHDLSWMHQPSISPHPQNGNFYDWTILIDLVRDAWEETAKGDQQRAAMVARSWMHTSCYPLFKRLALHAATNNEVIPVREALDWLLLDDAHWLWAVETQREAMRLLRSIAPVLNKTGANRLQQTILAGPPDDITQAFEEPAKREAIVEHEVWRRLKQLVNSEVPLEPKASKRLRQISQTHPTWQLQPDERDDFAFWMSEVEDGPRPVMVPRDHKELVEWLRENGSDPFAGQGWGERCRQNYDAASAALLEASQAAPWPAQRWVDALIAWREPDYLERSWNGLASHLAHAPEDAFADLSHGLGSWIEEQAKAFEGHEDSFHTIIRRLLDSEARAGTRIASEPLLEALNHPVGQATRALLDWWSRSSPKASTEIPDPIRSLLTEMCDVEINRFKHARVLLAANTEYLFRIDPEWTASHLLPLFKWDNSTAEARGAWSGFLWSPRIYPPLLAQLKEPFLETASHTSDLGEQYSQQYARLLTFVALDPRGAFDRKELQGAIHHLPKEALPHVAQQLSMTLQSAEDQTKQYWRNRIEPFLKQLFPRNRAARTTGVARQLALLCLGAKECFPEAVDVCRHWLMPLEFTADLVEKLGDEGFCSMYPHESLTLLARTISEDAFWTGAKLDGCLDSILAHGPQLKSDPDFVKLKRLTQR